MSTILRHAAAACLLVSSVPLAAETEEVPYWASVNAEVINMRVGPGETYRIDWVYRRMQLPLRVIRREEGWRLVEDPSGAKGWMLGRFLSRERTAIVEGEGLAEMRADGNDSARLLWRLEPGVVGKLGDCSDGWCRFDVQGHKGLVHADRLWGDGEP